MRYFPNLFYFGRINVIGGIETWFYNISRLYGQYDITIVCNSADVDQLRRLREKVRVIIWDGKEHFKCDRLFCNFNRDILDYVEAQKKYLVLHGDYLDMVERGQMKKENLPYDKRIDEYIGVSQQVCDSWYKITGVKATLCYNPVLLSEEKKIVRIISAQRMSKEKGKSRIEGLIKALDRQGIKWQWDIFTNDINAIRNPPVWYRPPQLFVDERYAYYDWFACLSDNEGFGYSPVEALGHGLPCIITPCPVFKELGFDETNSITLDFDLKNVDDVAIQIATKKLRFDYKAPSDNWGAFLVHKENTYKEERMKQFKVKALKSFERVIDTEAYRVRKADEEFIVSAERLEVLKNYHEPLIEVIGEIKEEPVKEKPKRKAKKNKA